MSIHDLYLQKCEHDKFNDMRPRIRDVFRYGSMAKVAVEFGTRTGNSTTALLAGGAEVYSYDLNPPEFNCPEDVVKRWHFTQADTTQLKEIPECDLLFIDTRHTRNHVTAELRMAKHVRKFILFHDVIVSGWKGDSNEDGVTYALLDFMRNNDRDWRLKEFLCDEFGLAVLERR